MATGGAGSCWSAVGRAVAVVAAGAAHGSKPEPASAVRGQRRGLLLRLGRVGVGLLVGLVGSSGLAGLLKLAADFGAGILELADALAEAARQLRNFIGPEENQDDDHDEHELRAAYIA